MKRSLKEQEGRVKKLGEKQGLDSIVIEEATGVSKSWLGRLKNEIWEKEN